MPLKSQTTNVIPRTMTKICNVRFLELVERLTLFTNTQLQVKSYLSLPAIILSVA